MPKGACLVNTARKEVIDGNDQNGKSGIYVGKLVLDMKKK